MVDFTYSVANDTAQAIVNAGLLRSQIETSNITIALDSVTSINDVLTVSFKAAISQTEQTTLTSLVNAHNGYERESDIIKSQILDVNLNPVASLKGDTGPQGPQGIPGDTGPQGPVAIFGSEAEEFLDVSSLQIKTSTLFAAKTYTTQSKPVGRYRIAGLLQIEPNSSSNNYLFQLRIDGVQIGLEMSEEGKDTASDNRNLRPVLGYYDHSTSGTFDIEIWAARESGTLVLHGVNLEIWRVS